MKPLLLCGIILAAALPASAGESRVVAALLSAAVPGAGQAYLGWRASAEAFLIAEGTVWGSRFYLKRRASGVEDAYIAYGASRAGSDPRYRDAAYYDDMTRYWNSERANQHYQDPDRYTGTRVWTWHSREEWRHFSSLVRDRRRWDSASTDIMALAVLTRVASIVHCLKAHRGPVDLTVTPTSLALSIAW